MKVHVGTSGWSYAHWHGVLYPHGVSPRERLDYYLMRYRTAELNSSYYRWPADASFTRWRRRLPEDFTLSVKAPGLLTHVARLYGPERWLARPRRRPGKRRPRRRRSLNWSCPNSASLHVECPGLLPVLTPRDSGCAR